MMTFALDEALNPIEVVYPFNFAVVKSELECTQVIENVVFDRRFQNGADVLF